MPSVKTTDRLIHLEKLLKVLLEEDKIRVCHLINTSPESGIEEDGICGRMDFTHNDCEKCVFSRVTEISKGIQSTINTLKVLGE